VEIPLYCVVKWRKTAEIGSQCVLWGIFAGNKKTDTGGGLFAYGFSIVEKRNETSETSIADVDDDRQVRKQKNSARVFLQSYRL
jgi:hypothetical protein